MRTIKLGRKYDSSICCAPANPGEKQPEVVYPSLYIEGVPGLDTLPEEGEMTVKYRICNRNENLKSDKTSLTLDIIAIKSAEEDTVDLAASTSESLDKLAEKVHEKMM